MTKTIRRPAATAPTTSVPQVREKLSWEGDDVRVGDTIYIRTYAGPIVKFRVKEVRYSSFVGCVDPDDNEKTYLAGCSECSDTQVSVFPPSRKVTRKEYEEEDWRIWIVRTEKKKKSQK